MKNYILRGLTVILLFCLTACNQSTPPPTTELPTNTPVSATVSTSTEIAPLLTDIPYVEELSLLYNMDDAGNEYIYRVPFVNLPGETAAAVNADLQVQLSYASLEAGEIPYSAVDYRWSLHADVLSLLIEAQKFDAAPSYWIYTLNVSDCEEASIREIVSTAGFSMEDYQAALQQAVEQAGLSFSEDERNAAMPFFDENGCLCALLAPSNQGPVLLSLT